MPSDPTESLPDIPDGKAALLTAQTWDQLQAVLRMGYPRAGPTLVARQTDDGVVLDIAAAVLALFPSFLQITLSKPSWFTGDIPDDVPAWITPGTAGAGADSSPSSVMPASNWNSGFSVTLGTALYFFAHITVPTADDLQVTGFEIVTGDASDSFVTAAFDVDTGNRPADYYVLLGYVDESGNVINFGNGSIMMEEYARDITKAAGSATVVARRLTHHRNG